MKPSTLLGAASALMTSKKAKIVFVALQLGYLAYTFIKDKPEENVEDVVK
ncbi:hypothetical protein ACJOV8_013090 [Formosa sp. 3Alg 14/1]